MIIYKVRIKNYRNFREFEIELKQNTLIIGANNVGKTNLLNALGLIFSNDISFYRKRSLEIDDINYNTVQSFKKEVAKGSIDAEKINFPEVSVEVWMKNFTKDQQAVVADWFIDDRFKEAKLTYIFQKKRDLIDWVSTQRDKISKINKRKKETKEEYLERKVLSVDFPLKHYGYTIYGGNDQTKRVDYYFLKMLKMEFLNALRNAKKELTASGDYRLLYHVLNNRNENNFEDLKIKLKELHDKVNENEELNKVKNEIENYLDKISLETKEGLNTIDFEFSRIEHSELLKKISLIYGTEPINIERNGLGRNNLLYISLILSHLTGAKSEDEIFFRLIALEEPEAHLHPHLQKHLAKNIEDESSENLQLIITSHSTAITSKLSLENTVILFEELDGDKFLTHYVLSGFKNKDGNISADNRKTIEYLKRYLDATNSEMFYARKLILVEGISEMILIPIFFERHTGVSLEKAGCSVINVNGVAFKHFLKVVNKGYFIKCAALTDRDTEATTDRAAILKKEYKEDGIIKIEISEESTFEKDIINSNKDGEEKDTLFKALVETRPINGKKLRDNTKNEIQIDDFFGEIEVRNSKGEKTNDYKSDFASNLFYELEKKGEGRFVNHFNIPEYIKDGFNFIYPQD